MSVAQIIASRVRMGIALIASVCLTTVPPPVCAAIPTCEIHNGMKVWFLDYAESDTSLAHPLGVASGTIDIDEKAWHAKCSADGPASKVFVPFNATSGIEKGQADSRFPKDVYRTKAEAQRAYRGA